MAYTVKARFYCGLDQLGESYVITSDNDELETKLEVGDKVYLVTKSQHKRVYVTREEGREGGLS